MLRNRLELCTEPSAGRASEADGSRGREQHQFVVTLPGVTGTDATDAKAQEEQLHVASCHPEYRYYLG